MPTAVLLDGSVLDGCAPGLNGALAAGRAAAGARLIVEVRADGVVIDPATADPEVAALRGVNRVEMLSADPTALARCTIHDAADALEDIATVQGDAAGLLQTGETDRAMALLRRALETWGNAAQTIDLVHQMGFTPNGDGGALSPDRAHATLNAALNAVRDALAAQDFTALADVLAYDLRDLARDWTRDLRTLAQQLGAPDADTGTGSNA